MRLPLHPQPDDQPWYADGLNFECTQCGNCCTGGPGFVWISQDEVHRLAQHLRTSVEAVVRKYCRRIGDRLSLKEEFNRGNYDCIFLHEEPPCPSAPGEPRRSCGIYSVRPTQCRTFPFWDGLLTSRQAWDRASDRCPGINNGRRYSREEVEQRRAENDVPLSNQVER